MERVLITGATGFVGSNLVRRFLSEGFQVHIISRKKSNMWRLRDILDDIVDHKVDLLDLELLKSTVKDIEPDYIIHLAIYGGRANQNEDNKILSSNLYGTINLLEASKLIDYKCFINTGSSSEYGAKSKPMSENDICNPDSIYGISKLSASLYCSYVSKVEGKNIGTLRLFSPFGDLEDKGRLIPDLIIGSLTTGSVNLANPEAVRDFIYIDDVCDIYSEVLKKPEKLKGEVFNVGYGKQHSVKEIADIVKRLVSNDVTYMFNSISGRKADTNTWSSNIDKVSEVFNWSPKYTMEMGLRKSIEWFSQNLELYDEGDL